MQKLRTSVMSILAASLAIPAATAMGISQSPVPIEAGAGASVGEPGTGGAFPDSQMGKCAAAFIEMVNDGSEAAVRKFEQTWGSKSRAAQRTIEDRVGGIASLHAEWGKVTPLGYTDNNGTLVLAAKCATGLSLWLDFQADTEEPTKLAGVMIKADTGPASAAIDKEQRSQVVRGAVSKLAESYVFPEVGEKMGRAVLASLESGAYDSITDEAAMAQRLTKDLQAVSHDKHLSVRLAPADAGHNASPMPEGDRARRENYAFRKVEILPGNIGYLRFDLFMDGPEAQNVATAAMGFLHNCDAVIFDLRSNGGGSPEMIRFLTSYFVAPKTHLNSMVDRTGKIVEEFWTLDTVPGERLSNDVPVFVLTSPRTFSGAEEFSYNLKNLKRGTIVGETTGGGAHPVRMERLNDRFVIGVPYMRAQNPISKTNWEGTGVEPDVKVSQAAALEKALELAREAIAAAGTSRAP